MRTNAQRLYRAAARREVGQSIDIVQYLWPKPEYRREERRARSSRFTPSAVQVAGIVGGACRCVHTALRGCRHVPSCLRRGNGVAVDCIYILDLLYFASTL